MRRRQRRQKIAVFFLLMAFLVAMAALLIQPGSSEAERISDPKPVSYKPPAQPNRGFVGPVKRTYATVRPMPKMALREGRYIVVDLSEQRLYEMDGGRLSSRPIKVSTGIGQYATPTGEFKVYRKLRGKAWSQKWRGWMYDMLMFNGKIYIHGTVESNYYLLGQPASHGCVRVHQDQARRLIEKYEVGTPVIVQA